MLIKRLRWSHWSNLPQLFQFPPRIFQLHLQPHISTGWLNAWFSHLHLIRRGGVRQPSPVTPFVESELHHLLRWTSFNRQIIILSLVFICHRFSCIGINLHLTTCAKGPLNPFKGKIEASKQELNWFYWCLSFIQILQFRSDAGATFISSSTSSSSIVLSRTWSYL